MGTDRRSDQTVPGRAWKLIALAHTILFLAVINFGSSRLDEPLSLVRLGLLLGQLSGVSYLVIRIRVLGLIAQSLPWVFAAITWFTIKRIMQWASNEAASAWWACLLASQVMTILIAASLVDHRQERRPLSIGAFLHFTTLSASAFAIILLGSRSDVWSLEAFRWDVCSIMCAVGVTTGMLATGSVYVYSVRRRVLQASLVAGMVLLGGITAIILYTLFQSTGIYMGASDLPFLFGSHTLVVLVAMGMSRLIMEPATLPKHAA
ncbi:MAG: hypothetical protein AAGJ83_05305 [Planctomycetota bacterium]